MLAGGKKAAGQAASWHTLEGSDWLKSTGSTVRACMAWPFSRASICSCVKLVLFLCSFLLSCSLSWDSSPSSRSTGTPPPLAAPPPPASPPMLPSVSSRQPSDTARRGKGDKRDVWAPGIGKKEKMQSDGASQTVRLILWSNRKLLRQPQVPCYLLISMQFECDETELVISDVISQLPPHLCCVVSGLQWGHGTSC